MSIFTKKFIDPSPEWYGLDLSDLSVKVAHLKKHGKYVEIEGMASEDIPNGCIADGNITKPEVVIEKIHAACAKADISLKNVVCSLPETKAFLRIISIPKMSFEEAGEAIKWEMEANIPMTIDQVYYDWQILPQRFNTSSGKMNVLVVAVARMVVDQFLDVLQGAGFSVRGFEVESMAQARSLLHEPTEETTMIVDIGDRRTSFLIVVAGVPVFTSSIPLSAEAMTDVIAKSLNLSRTEAEKVKITNGIGSVLKNDHIFQAMRPVIDSFVVEINKSTNFFLTGLRYSEKIDKIILCGGGAKTKGLVPYLSRQLGRDIELGNPWVNLPFKSIPTIDREASVQYATAIGLATKPLNN